MDIEGEVLDPKAFEIVIVENHRILDLSRYDELPLGQSCFFQVSHDSYHGYHLVYLPLSYRHTHVSDSGTGRYMTLRYRFFGSDEVVVWYHRIGIIEIMRRRLRTLISSGLLLG